MSRGRMLAALCCAAVAALASAGSAQALSYCVTPATGCDLNGVAAPQIALNDAQASPGPDTVVLGAMTYTGGSGYTYNATGANSVEIDGAGRAATTLHTTADHQPVLTATGGAAVASATFSLKPGQSRAVPLRLTSTALKALRTRHKLKTATTFTSTEVGRLTAIPRDADAQAAAGPGASQAQALIQDGAAVGAIPCAGWGICSSPDGTTQRLPTTAQSA